MGNGRLSPSDVTRSDACLASKVIQLGPPLKDWADWADWAKEMSSIFDPISIPFWSLVFFSSFFFAFLYGSSFSGQRSQRPPVHHIQRGDSRDIAARHTTTSTCDFQTELKGLPLDILDTWTFPIVSCSTSYCESNLFAHDMFAHCIPSKRRILGLYPKSSRNASTDLLDVFFGNPNAGYNMIQLHQGKRTPQQINRRHPAKNSRILSWETRDCVEFSWHQRCWDC